jgi:hypothetical protein
MQASKKHHKVERRQAAATLALAQTLPVSLLLHLVYFLPDSSCVARFGTVCRGWQQSTSKSTLADRCWRALYLRDWELESTATDAECADGSTRGNSSTTTTTPPWKQRYQWRLQVERNWRDGRGRLTHSEHINAYRVFAGHSHVAVTLDNGWLALLDMNGKETRRWRPHAHFINKMIFVDDKRLLTAGERDIVMSDVERGAELHKFADGHQEGLVDFMELNGARLVSADTVRDIRVWNIDSRQCTHVIRHANTRGLAVNWSIGVIVAADRRGDFTRFRLWSGDRLGVDFYGTSYMQSLSTDSRTGRIFGTGKAAGGRDVSHELSVSATGIANVGAPLPGRIFRTSRDPFVVCRDNGAGILLHDMRNAKQVQLLACEAETYYGAAATYRKLFLLRTHPSAAQPMFYGDRWLDVVDFA